MPPGANRTYARVGWKIGSHTQRKVNAMSCAARLGELVNEHLDLDRDPQWDGGLADSGVSSLDAVAFKKVVEKEFGVSVPPECFDTLRKLAAYIDSQAG